MPPWRTTAADDVELKTLPLSVDAYYVNIGTGDGAIYYLVQHPPPGTVDAKPFIHRAVLIDAGHGDNGSKAMNDFLANVPHLYYFDTTQGGDRPTLGFPPFDSILVTHWDKDHYAGISKLLLLHAKSKFKEAQLKKENLDTFSKTYLSPYLKYTGPSFSKDAAPTPLPRGDRAATTLYAPYYPKTTVYKGFELPNKTLWALRLFDGFKKGSEPPNRNPYLTSGNFLDLEVEANVVDAAGNTTTYWALQLIKVVAGPAYMLGTNLFTGITPSQDAAMAMESPQALAVTHNDTNDKTPQNAWPVLAIVAGMIPYLDDWKELQTKVLCCGDSRATYFEGGKKIDAKYIQLAQVTKIQKAYDASQSSLGAKATDKESDAEPREPEVKEYLEKRDAGEAPMHTAFAKMKKLDLSDQHGSPGSNSVEQPVPIPPGSSDIPITAASAPRRRVQRVIEPAMTNTKPKLSNGTSLATLVVWTSGQISSFQSGDAPWGTELAVVAWIQTSNNPSQTVRTVKIGHHGASDSTAGAMIRAFQPRKLILQSNTRDYGHPRPETLLWLYLWYRITFDNRLTIGHDNTPGPGELITALTYPGYLLWSTGGGPTGAGDFEPKPNGGFNGVQPTFNDFGVNGKAAVGSTKAFQDSLTTLGKLLVPPYDLVAEFKLATDDDARRKLAQTRVLQAWPVLSTTGASCVISGVLAHNTQTYGPVKTADEIKFIKSYCRPIDQGRRRAADGYMDGYAKVLTGTDFARFLAESRFDIPDIADMDATLPSGLPTTDSVTPPMLGTEGGKADLASDIDVRMAEAEATGGEEFGRAVGDATKKRGLRDSRTEGVVSSEDHLSLKKPKPTGPEVPALLSWKPQPGLATATARSAEASDIPQAQAAAQDQPAYPFFLVPDFVAPTWVPPLPSPVLIYKVPSGMDTQYPADVCAIFLTLLDSRALMVAPTGTQAGGGGAGQLLPEDNLASWLAAATKAPLAAAGSQAAQAVTSVAWSGSSAAASISSFGLSLPGVGDRPALEFSSASLQGNFANQDGKVLRPGGQEAPLPSAGFISTHKMLLLGLKRSSDPWSLVGVLKEMHIIPGKGLAATVLGALINKISNVHFTLQKGMLWFAPRENYNTTLRLEWSLDAAGTQSLAEWCSSWMPRSDMQIVNPRLVARRACRRIVSPGKWNMRLTHQMLATFTIGSANRDTISDSIALTCGLDLNLATGARTIKATIRVDPPSSFVDILQWLIPGVNFRDAAKMIPESDNILLHSVEINLIQTDKKRPTVSSVIVTTEYSNPSWTVRDEHGDTVVVPLLLTYTYTPILSQPHGISLRVWFEPELLSWFPTQIMPGYEGLYALRPSRPAPASISLQSLMPSSGESQYTLPSELDLAITGLSLELQDRTVSFRGSLRRRAGAEAGKSSLGIHLDEVALTASFSWADAAKKKPANYSINLYIEFGIEGDPSLPVGGPDSDTPEEGVVACNISLVKQDTGLVFQLVGSVQNINLGQAGRFFPSGDREIVADLLGHFEILNLDMVYNYGSGGSANDFAMSGVLIIAEVLELDISFIRQAKSGWSFDAVLHTAADHKLTVGDVLESVMGDARKGQISSVPSYVRNIDLARASFKVSLRSEDPVPRIGDLPAQPGRFIASVSLDIPAPEGTVVKLAFLQITTKTPTGNAPSARNMDAATKRLIKVTLGGLPWGKIPKVPVIDKMQPAFDELGFYWVQDLSAPDPSGKPQGLTRVEVENLNQVSTVAFKEKSTSTDPTKDMQASGTIVLDAGMHFMVLDSGGQGSPRAILDYLFKKPARQQQTLVFGKRGLVPGGSDTMESTPTGTSKGTLEKTVGPFRIQNVGIRFEDDELIIFVDILANLGPIKLALLGFGIGVNLKSGNLKDVATQVPSFHLQGMGVEFNQPPVGVAGLFVERKTETSTMYVGGIALTVQPYSFMAVGGYGEVKRTDGGDGSFKTVFFFAKLNGPLIELEFATIGGICLGFGYNSHIRFPSAAEVPGFPLIASSSLPDDSPLATMTKLSSSDPKTGVVSPREGSYWLAAGLSAKAMQVLEVSAVVVLEFNPYVSLGLFATAVGQMPPAPTPREACFLFVELGLAATVDFRAGALRVEAQLSPNSFVLAPMCHLTGGFALCYWFAPSPHSGDFVFTVGGYHAAFRPPIHYPKPPRLAISWRVDDDLMITGQAYFAVTPKVCMGGGMLKANFDQGLLHAWLTAHADFLIEYHPFSLEASIGLRVGVKFTMEAGFLSTDVGGEIRAELTLWGVPFGGNVYVDFWVFGFTIDFGEDRQTPHIDMAAFRTLLAQVPDADAQAAGGQGPTVDRLHVLSVERGRYTQKTREGDAQTRQGAVWEVKSGGFAFRVQSRVPLQAVSEPGFNGAAAAPTAVAFATPFYAIPMHQESPLVSTMTVSVSKEEGNREDPVEFIVVAPVVKQVPLALWGRYDPHHAPGKGKNNIGSLLDPSGGAVDLMMGATFKGPPPDISDDKIVPFDVLQSQSLDVFTNHDTGHPALPPTVSFQPDTWKSAPPPQGGGAAAAWEGVVAKWAAPDLAVPPVPVVGGEDVAEQKPVDVVGLTMGLWSGALGWTYGADVPDPTSNQLNNDLRGKGSDQPLVWRDFEKLYMAAPLVGVSA